MKRRAWFWHLDTCDCWCAAGRRSWAAWRWREKWGPMLRHPVRWRRWQGGVKALACLLDPPPLGSALWRSLWEQIAPKWGEAFGHAEPPETEEGGDLPIGLYL